MHNKKIPIRMCCGCGKMKPKKELVRVVKAPDNSIFLDLTGKKSGRGAYICRSRECLKSARKSRKLERDFACQISAELYEAMENELTAENN